MSEIKSSSRVSFGRTVPEPELTVTYWGEVADRIYKGATSERLAVDEYLVRCVEHYERPGVATAVEKACAECVSLVGEMAKWGKMATPCFITWPCGHAWEFAS